MGTTRIKVIDLSAGEKEIKTSRKHAEKLAGVAKLKEKKVSKVSEVPKVSEEKGITEVTESVSPEEHPRVFGDELRRIGEVEAIPGKHPGGEKKISKSSVPPVIKTKSKVTTGPRHRGKKYQQAAKLIDKNKSYLAKEALELLSQTSITRFDPTVEIHLNVTDKNMRGSVNFPHPIGSKIKEKRYLVFSDKRQATSDKQIIFGDESTITDIESGKLRPKRDFDLVVAQPKFMPQLAKIAKILGPAGMMPNPKNGTIADNPATAIDKSQSAGLEFKTDPTAPIIHTQIGKLSAKPAQLDDNLKALIATIGPAKIRKAVIKSTMSPAIKINLQTIGQSDIK